MRKLILPVTAAAALAVVALDATPAEAQFMISSGYYSSGYSGGYTPYSYGGPRIVIGGGGVGFGAYPAYAGYPAYGYRDPYYGGRYSPSYGGRYSPSYGGGQRVYSDSGYSGYRGNYRGGWRR